MFGGGLFDLVAQQMDILFDIGDIGIALVRPYRIDNLIGAKDAVWFRNQKLEQIILER